LSAGGPRARAYQSATLAELAELTGWDPRHATVVVGTSAGAAGAAYLRAGLAPEDDFAFHAGVPLSAEGRAILARARDAKGSGTPPPATRGLLRPSLAARAALGRTRLLTAASGLLPRGHRSGHDLGDPIRALWGHAWPEAPTWICAVRVRDGKRVVFGRDDVLTPDIGTAAQASCAIPKVMRPVRVGRDEYIDGATHSSTNAELTAALALDLVIIVSAMTAVPSASGFNLRRPGVSWFSRVLAREVATLRETGTEVLVIQPTAADLHARRGNHPLATIATQARTSARHNLARPQAAGAVEILRAAAVASSTNPSGQ
jgi:NTE family protein